MPNPKVSVIVPIYKVERYLDRCMSSLLNQTLKDIEIIMVDDGSPDNCPAMCDDYAKRDARIKVIHKVNGGLGYARNSGLAVATGDYVAFVDSDDFVDLNMYESLYNMALKEQLDTCFCSYCRYYDGGKRYPSSDSKSRELFLQRGDIDRLMFGMSGQSPDSVIEMSAWRAIYSMDIIRQNNIQFVSEKVIASEDIIFNIDYLLKASRVGYTPEQYYFYYFNSNSISTNFNQTEYERMLKLLYLVEKKYSENYSVEQYERYLCYHILRIFKVVAKFDVSRAKSLSGSAKLFNEHLSEPIFSYLFKSKEFVANLSLSDRILIVNGFKSKNNLLLYLIQRLKLAANL